MKFKKIDIETYIAAIEVRLRQARRKTSILSDDCKLCDLMRTYRKKLEDGACDFCPASTEVGDSGCPRFTILRHPAACFGSAGDWSRLTEFLESKLAEKKTELENFAEAEENKM